MNDKTKCSTAAGLSTVALIGTLLVSGCGANGETGTVIDKVQRVEADCTTYAPYRAGEKRRCVAYEDAVHWYLIVQLDNTGTETTQTVEVPVTIEVYNKTTVGSRYAK